jgi:hypothetical protein
MPPNQALPAKIQRDFADNAQQASWRNERGAFCIAGGGFRFYYSVFCTYNYDTY